MRTPVFVGLIELEQQPWVDVGALGLGHQVYSSFAFYVRGEARGVPLSSYQEFGFLMAKRHRGDRADM